ncbi:MLO-like protein 6 [Zostera marina]|uniref:MLO-like protein n=1 Tax=Zostera marina TaxID=29655 RepID=A0A0K9NK13_ZOSMR|nr:MLO-like protein 6 [Zostera marina]
MDDYATKQKSLEETPTWAVAVVCFILVAISLVIEKLLHHLGTYLLKKNKRSLYESLEKVKAELMLLGFISLLLTITQDSISDICVPKSIGASWHPCTDNGGYSSSKMQGDFPGQRRLLQTNTSGTTTTASLRRVLASSGEDVCTKKGKVALVSTYAIHQLHIFIFCLAIVHVLYCIITMILGRLKLKKWKAWENETRSAEYQFSHDPERFRFARETSFGRRHLNFWSKSDVLIWIVCFFRQFVTSVSKVDYMTLRHGFIMKHLAPQNSVNFNFQKYIKRSLEKDFQIVVEISPLVWFFAVLFLLFNTQGWYSYLWLPFIPLVILLLVGTKLQVIITRMALQIMERDDVVKGVPVVLPADNLFWFNRPRLMLHLINFVLFENAFQIAFFIFSWYKFGLKSCFHEKIEDIIIRMVMGVLIQILCSYVTLPLYALVTQMGSNMKPVIFNERVAAGLKYWHSTARKHIKENRKSGSVTPLSSTPATPVSGYSPVHLLKHTRNGSDGYLDSINTSQRVYSIGEGAAHGGSSHRRDISPSEKMKPQASGDLEMQIGPATANPPPTIVIPLQEDRK